MPVILRTKQPLIWVSRAKASRNQKFLILLQPTLQRFVFVFCPGLPPVPAPDSRENLSRVSVPEIKFVRHVPGPKIEKRQTLIDCHIVLAKPGEERLSNQLYQWSTSSHKS